MKMKKTLTAVVALALVAAVSVAGTMAYLTKVTGPVTNTFTAGNLGESMNLELWENPVQANAAGEYKKSSEDHVNGNNYEGLLPNSTNDKNPTVTVSDLTTNAYLFIEVVNDASDDIEATVDTKNWTKLEGVQAVTENAEVYAYAVNNGIVNATSKLDVTVLENNQFHVKDFGNDATPNFKALTVKSYICQAAGFENAADAWTKAFKA